MKLLPSHLPYAQLTCIALAFCTALRGVAAAGESATDPDPKRFAAEIQRFEELDRKSPSPSEAILFVGSSSIRLWPTAKDFSDLPVINRGFGGSHISDVNHFARRIVIKDRPRAIVFYAGDNDIAFGKSPEQVVKDFHRFLALVAKELPETRIVYLPIKPSLARWKLWPLMDKVNSHIEELAWRNNRLEYVDTATPMLGDDGQPRPELFLDDGLHLNAAGYEIWAKALKPALSRVD